MTHVMENKIKHFLSDKEKEKLKNKKNKRLDFSFIHKKIVPSFKGTQNS